MCSFYCLRTRFDWGSWLLKVGSAMRAAGMGSFSSLGTLAHGIHSPCLLGSWAQFSQKDIRVQDGCAPLPRSLQVPQELHCYLTWHMLDNYIIHHLTIVIILTFSRAKFLISSTRYFYTWSLILTLPHRLRNHEVDDVYLGYSFRRAISNALILNFSFEMHSTFYFQINILFHI